MKRGRRTYVGLFLLFGVIASFLIFRWQSGQLPLSEKASPRTDTSRKSDSISLATVQPNDEATQRRLAIVRDVVAKANQPIDFFGQVVDQDDRPILGVHVTMNIRSTKETFPGAAEDRFDSFVVDTDATGYFAVRGEQGSLLSVKALEKAGYEASPAATRKSYWYAASGLPKKFAADASKPEIFRMWRKRGSEYLLETAQSVEIPYDGTRVNFDLVQGRRVESGGDFHVRLTRQPRDLAYGQTNFEWTATFEADSGGLIRTFQEQAYYAPDGGYQPQVTIHMPANDPQWSATLAATFYLRLAGGERYGRVTVELNAGFAKAMTAFAFRAYVNPSGSRNLEYDPAQDVIKEPVSRIKQQIEGSK